MVYLSTFTIKNQPNVGEYAIHGYTWIYMDHMGYVVHIYIYDNTRKRSREVGHP